jgi:hypothetical protein
VTATVYVQAFHNLDAWIFGYEPGHRMRPAFAAQMPAADPHEVCEAVFVLLNVGDCPPAGAPDPRAVDFRRDGHRSLSTGDVIAISEDAQARPTYYSVDSAGFTELASEPRIVGGIGRRRYPDCGTHEGSELGGFALRAWPPQWPTGTRSPRMKPTSAVSHSPSASAPAETRT